MKLIHTADWHIGKILLKNPLSPELADFFKWLIDFIQSESIDILLVSGDVFDLANPSAIDRKSYYNFLSQLIGLDIKIIITGGNHDSAGFLNAPKDILEMLNITIIGGATEQIEDELVEVRNTQGEIELIVAAVPFLKDKDIRSIQKDEHYATRVEAIRQGIRKHYHTLQAICEAKYPDIPRIAMGHLFATSANRSESERDIHIGNQASIDETTFGKWDYVALGHIHKPQKVNFDSYIRYSGSPIALSFSEKDDEKCIVLLEMEEGKLNKPKEIKLPTWRIIKKFSGNFEEIKTALHTFKPESPYTAFVEIEVNEPVKSSTVLRNIDELVYSFNDHDQFNIIKHKSHFEDAKIDQNTFEVGTKAEDLSALQVFKKRLKIELLEEEYKEDLIVLFQQIVESVQESEEI